MLDRRGASETPVRGARVIRPRRGAGQSAASPTGSAGLHSVAGAKMAGPPPHDHAKDKMGHAVGMKGTPPSKEEMAAMHRRCAEMMAKTEAPAKK